MSNLRTALIAASLLGLTGGSEWKPQEAPSIEDLIGESGSGISRGSRPNKYKPHQGAKERARRMKQS